MLAARPDSFPPDTLDSRGEPPAFAAPRPAGRGRLRGARRRRQAGFARASWRKARAGAAAGRPARGRRDDDGDRRRVARYRACCPARQGLSLGAGAGRFVIEPCTAAQAQTGACFPEQGFYPGIPASPGALLGYLNKIEVVNTQNRPAGSPGWLSNDVAKGISYLMGTTYLPPGQRAALFELMARMPASRSQRGRGTRSGGWASASSGRSWEARPVSCPDPAGAAGAAMPRPGRLTRPGDLDSPG